MSQTALPQVQDDAAPWSYETEADAAAPYRRVSMLAVSSLALVLVGALGLWAWQLLVFAGLAVVLGLFALSAIHRRPEEFTGGPLAWTGLVAGALLAVVGGGYHSFVYATECPEGHARISFRELQPDKEHPESPVPPAALQLDGQKVFVKGYVYPDGRQGNIQQFVLVPDMGTCCFGGQPKLTDMIEVTLDKPLSVQWSTRKRSLAGVLRVDTRLKPVDGLGGVYYRLECHQVR